MNFISLGELVGIGVDVQKRKFTTPPQSAEEEQSRQIQASSNVAAELHQAFYNATVKGSVGPNWAEINHQTRKPLLNAAIVDEGMAMLMHLCGWPERHLKETIQNAEEGAALERAGYSKDQIVDTHDPRGGAYKDMFRASEIGFDCDGLPLWLVSHGAIEIGEAVQERERKRCSRCTLLGASMTLSRATGTSVDRWVETITKAVVSGELAARNPSDYEDQLPYTPENVPGWTYPIREYYEQTSASDLDAWLDKHPAWNVDFRFSVPGDDLGRAPVAIKSLPRQRQQEMEILRVLAELGYEAKALPQNPPGKNGPKSEVRTRIGERDMTRAVFNLAWKRLRASGEIAGGL